MAAAYRLPSLTPASSTKDHLMTNTLSSATMLVQIETRTSRSTPIMVADPHTAFCCPHYYVLLHVLRIPGYPKYRCVRRQNPTLFVPEAFLSSSKVLLFSQEGKLAENNSTKLRTLLCMKNLGTPQQVAAVCSIDAAVAQVSSTPHAKGTLAHTPPPASAASPLVLPDRQADRADRKADRGRQRLGVALLFYFSLLLAAR